MTLELASVVGLLMSVEASPDVLAENIAAYRAQESLSRAAADDLIAKYVALEFVRGELSYADADVAMNNLVSLDAHGFDYAGLAYQVYLHFDNGEYRRPSDPEDSIPWQQYTLPGVMALLKERGIDIWLWPPV